MQNCINKTLICVRLYLIFFFWVWYNAIYFFTWVCFYIKFSNKSIKRIHMYTSLYFCMRPVLKLQKYRHAHMITWWVYCIQWEEKELLAKSLSRRADDQNCTSSTAKIKLALFDAEFYADSDNLWPF